MLGRSVQLAIPRRIVVCYLLFSLMATLWLTVSVTLVSRFVLRQHSESELLAYLGQAGSTTTLEYLRNQDERLQPLVERFRRERGLLYGAVISADNRVLAHTRRGLVGKVSEQIAGEHFQWGEFEAVRFRGENGKYIREYRAPLEIRGERMGSLRLAREEPDLWDSLQSSALYTPFALAIPLVFIGAGAFVLQRLVRPLSAIEGQLQDLSTAPTLRDVELHPVDASTAGAIGWNRILSHLREQSGDGSSLEERLSEAVGSMRQSRNDDVLRSLSEGVAVTDREGRITFCNSALNALLGEIGDSTHSLQNQLMEEVLAFDPEQEHTLLRSEFRKRPVVEELERGQGDIRQVLRITRTPLRGESAGSGHVWSIRDITQQKLADEARNHFLDTVTHEFRTPLTNIRAYAETLALSEESDPESQKEFCNIITAESTRLGRFIDDLLSISSMEAGSLMLDRQEVEPERLFREVVEKVAPQMKQKRLTFDVAFPEKYPPMRLDKDKISVALVNLLGNAAKYTPEGGEVAFVVALDTKQLRIDIRDTGVGIDAEELPRVFDKFFRSANPAVREQVGTGLGLSMAHEVIRLHGGELKAESTLGAGTTFTVFLPVK